MTDIIFWTGIWPNWTTRSIGAYQLAHWLRTHNINCQVIDFCQWMASEELLDLTETFITDKTKYIGISTTFWPPGVIPKNIKDAIDHIRKYNTSIKFIFGGGQNLPHEIKDIADIVITGEAESKLVELIKGHNIGSSTFDITQLAHRFDQRDCIIDGEVLPIELGRGCIFQCKFCGHHNLGKSKHTYQRCIHLIEEELVYNYEQFKTVNYHFLDDTVNEDQDKVLNLSMLPKRTGIDIAWTGYLRADLLWRYPDTPFQLKESGLKSCFFGIESFHPLASRSIGKGWSGKHAKEYLPKLYKDIWNKEIPIWNNFIVGLPHETNEDLLETVRWCKNNPMGIHRFVNLNLYTNRSGDDTTSEFGKNYKDYGYKLDSQGSWSSPTMTERGGDQMCSLLNTVLRSTNTLACWMLFDLINCGITVDSGKSILLKDQHNYKKNFESFLNTYKLKLKSTEV